MNFPVWLQKMFGIDPEVEEGLAKHFEDYRKQGAEIELRREHERISGLMQIKAQSLLPQLVKVYERDLQGGARTLNDLAQMALDTVEYLKSKVNNKEVFEQMITNEWGEGHPPTWFKDGEPIQVPLGTLEKLHKEQNK